MQSCWGSRIWASDSVFIWRLRQLRCKKTHFMTPHVRCCVVLAVLCWPLECVSLFLKCVSACRSNPQRDVSNDVWSFKRHHCFTLRFIASNYFEAFHWLIAFQCDSLAQRVSMCIEPMMVWQIGMVFCSTLALKDVLLFFKMGLLWGDRDLESEVNVFWWVPWWVQAVNHVSRFGIILMLYYQICYNATYGLHFLLFHFTIELKWLNWSHNYNYWVIWCLLCTRELS